MVVLLPQHSNQDLYVCMLSDDNGESEIPPVRTHPFSKAILRMRLSKSFTASVICNHNQTIVKTGKIEIRYF